MRPKNTASPHERRARRNYRAAWAPPQCGAQATDYMSAGGLSSWQDVSDPTAPGVL